VIKMCAGAMQAGAKGVTFGRNIFQHKNPPAVIHALYKVIMQGQSPEEALKDLGKNQK
jgi:fructose-bisphosphate aldolase / 2-amino-3,7-dideoxy-D-threo-hept-6-ulosonate synthase